MYSIKEKMSTPEEKPLITAAAAQTAAIASVAVINQAGSKIKKASQNGPLTFRMMGFVGGIAMVISNGLAILDRFMGFNWPGALIAFYECIFGIMIVLLEMPNIKCCQPEGLGHRIRYYCKFLEYTWGRGLFYFFVGSLQFSNFNMLDWAVGGYMMFAGFSAIVAGRSAAKSLQAFKRFIKNEEELKRKWEENDINGDGTMDVKELTAFIRSTGIKMTKNEIASTYMALDKNFDEKLTYEEFCTWWMNNEQGQISV